MVQKYLAIIAVLVAIAGLNLGMVASHVQADGTGVCPCGNGKGFWTCANCDSYTEQPQVKQTSDEYTCHFWKGGYSQCEPGPFYSFHQLPQAQLKEIAYVQPTNCFWSYPVQCN